MLEIFRDRERKNGLEIATGAKAAFRLSNTRIVGNQETNMWNICREPKRSGFESQNRCSEPYTYTFQTLGEPLYNSR